MKTLVLLLLTVLAILQFQWIDQLSLAEKVRMESLFNLTSQQVTVSFQREMSELVRSFRGPVMGKPHPMNRRERSSLEGNALPDLIKYSWLQWETNSLFPEIIKELYLINFSQSQGHARELQIWNRQSSKFVAASWPVGSPELRVPRVTHRREFGSLNHWVQLDLPGIYLPIMLQRSPGGNERERRRAFILVLFDREIISSTILPTIFKDIMGATGDESVRARVLDQEGRSLFDSHPDQPVPSFVPASMVDLFPATDRLGPFSNPGDGSLQHWTLHLYHVKGDLQAVISTFRWRHLVLGSLVLLLVAISTFLVQTNAKRSVQLAKKQIDFVAGISHELLTPLAGIQSAGENLTEGLVQDSAKIKLYGEMISKEGKRLTNLVTQILHFSKIESQDQTLNFEVVSLEELLLKSIQANKERLDESGVVADIMMPKEPIQLAVDCDSILRVFKNLIENTCKYASSGKKLEIDISEKKGVIVIQFRNFGPIISKEESQKIFSPFYRGSQVVASNIHGTGLGLHIVKSIIENHGGSVSLQSSIEETVFEILLPKLNKGETHYASTNCAG